MNYTGLFTIYKKEIQRTYRILGQTIISPVITTSLYFVVFGAAIGSKVSQLDGVSYGAYIIPGLIMLSITTNSLSACSSGVFMPKFSGIIYELLTAPLSYLEICMGFVAAALTRAVLIVSIIFLISYMNVDITIKYPFFSIIFTLITGFSFGMLGFVIGLVAQSFDHIALIPNFIITPLSFLGGVFYSIEMLPEMWQKISLFNPFVYIINGLRFGFYGVSDVDPFYCSVIVLLFSMMNLLVILWIFRTGFRLRP